MPERAKFLAPFLSAVLVIVPGRPAAAISFERAPSEKPSGEPRRDARGDRQALVRLFRHVEVRELADRLGLDLEQAEAKITAVDGPELRELADQARQIDQRLAGGPPELTLSTATRIIVLLVLVLMVLTTID